MERLMQQQEKPGSSNKSSSFFKPAVQKKLSVGASNDTHEIEADNVANKVMRMAEPGKQQFSAAGNSIQKCAACEKEEKLQKKPISESISPLIQRSAKDEGESAAPGHIENQINSSRGGGNVMENGPRNFMENRFGADFSNIKIHTGPQAVQMSRELNAQAFTVGNDIYFNEGKYSPNSANGQHLLAHELTHTIQQGGIKRKIQKSCHDGNCATCGGGNKDLWVSVFFRVMPNRTTMANLRSKMDDAKRVLRNCCVNLKFDFNWQRIRGSSTMPAATLGATAADRWHYTADQNALGSGTVFSGARGIPMLVVDDVPLSGGGVTVSHTFDPAYTGRDYFIIALNQTNNTTSSIAHELSHIVGGNHGQAGNSTISEGTGNAVNQTYCSNVRALVP
jgi:hypothetical protein